MRRQGEVNARADAKKKRKEQQDGVNSWREQKTAQQTDQSEEKEKRVLAGQVLRRWAKGACHLPQE